MLKSVIQLAVHSVLCLLADMEHSSTRGAILIVNLVSFYSLHFFFTDNKI
jgi:hypothetical protein